MVGKDEEKESRRWKTRSRIRKEQEWKGTSLVLQTLTSVENALRSQIVHYMTTSNPYFTACMALCISHQLRARRALSIFKNVLLRTRRTLSLHKFNGNSALLFLNGTSLNSDSALLVLNWRYASFSNIVINSPTVKKAGWGRVGAEWFCPHNEKWNPP